MVCGWHEHNTYSERAGTQPPACLARGWACSVGTDPRRPVPSVTQGTTRGGCTRSPLPSPWQKPQHCRIPAARTGRMCVPQWSRSRAFWVASSPPSSSADSSPSSPGGWPPARLSPASLASTSTSTWQPPDWRELGRASGRSRCSAAGPLAPALAGFSPFGRAGGTHGHAHGDTSATSSRHDGFYASGPPWAAPAPAADHRCACSHPAAAPGCIPPAPLPLS